MLGIYIYMSEISYGIMIRKVSDQYDIVGLKLKPFKSSSILLYIYIYIYIYYINYLIGIPPNVIFLTNTSPTET